MIEKRETVPESNDSYKPISNDNIGANFSSNNVGGEFSLQGKNASMKVSANDNDGNVTANVTASGNVQMGDVHFNANGEYNIHKEAKPEYNFDLIASSNIKKSEWTANFHNDRSDTSLSFNLKKPLLRRDNNPNNAEAEYQEQKEDLIQNGDRFNLSFKSGYSNEEKGFYTTNSAMINFGNDYLLSLKYDNHRYADSFDFKADMKKVNVEYKYLNIDPKDGIKTETNNVDVVYKGKKNIYTANFSQETTYPDKDTRNRNIGFGGKVSLNRTEYGEFKGGLSGEIEANVTQQGYKLVLDGSFHKYGDGEKDTKDFLISSVSMLDKNDSGTTFETGLFSALRFNNCKTIIEPHTIFNITKDGSGNVLRTYSNGVGVYQQVGKHFGDACVYVKGEHVLKHGGSIPNHTEVTTGLRKKATAKLTMNAEGTWKSNGGVSGNIGLAYHF